MSARKSVVRITQFRIRSQKAASSIHFCVRIVRIVIKKTIFDKINGTTLKLFCVSTPLFPLCLFVFLTLVRYKSSSYTSIYTEVETKK